MGTSEPVAGAWIPAFAGMTAVSPVRLIEPVAQIVISSFQDDQISPDPVIVDPGAS